MILSMCCGDYILVEETENGGYYVCNRCAIPCNTVSVMCFQDFFNSGSNVHEIVK